MASKRHQRKRSCEWKRSYATQAAAVSAVISLRKRTGDRTGDRTRAYHCEHCGRWHHGRMSRRQKQGMIAKRGY